MEIDDLRLQQKAKTAAQLAAKATADKYVPLVQSSPKKKEIALPEPVVLCGSCKHWGRPDAEAVFASCDLSTQYGYPAGIPRSDRDSCSRGVKRA